MGGSMRSSRVSVAGSPWDRASFSGGCCGAWAFQPRTFRFRTRNDLPRTVPVRWSARSSWSLATRSTPARWRTCCRRWTPTHRDLSDLVGAHGAEVLALRALSERASTALLQSLIGAERGAARLAQGG